MSRLTAQQLEEALQLLARGAWQDAHGIVQQDEVSPLACWAHGIVHVLEGDLANARYWYRRAGRAFPADIDVQTEVQSLREASGGSVAG